MRSMYGITRRWPRLEGRAEAQRPHAVQALHIQDASGRGAPPLARAQGLARPDGQASIRRWRGASGPTSYAANNTTGIPGVKLPDRPRGRAEVLDRPDLHRPGHDAAQVLSSVGRYGAQSPAAGDRRTPGTPAADRRAGRRVASARTPAAGSPAPRALARRLPGAGGGPGAGPKHQQERDPRGLPSPGRRGPIQGGGWRRRDRRRGCRCSNPSRSGSTGRRRPRRWRSRRGWRSFRARPRPRRNPCRPDSAAERSRALRARPPGRRLEDPSHLPRCAGTRGHEPCEGSSQPRHPGPSLRGRFRASPKIFCFTPGTFDLEK